MILLRFHAEWCMPCKASLPSWSKYQELHPELSMTSYDVDHDNNKKLLEQYEISSVPTVVLLADDGTYLNKHIGMFNTFDLDKLFPHIKS